MKQFSFQFGNMGGMKGINMSVMVLLGILVGSTFAKNAKSPTDSDFDDKVLEREALASVQEDIHRAELDESKGEMVKTEGQQAVSLTKQDLANIEIDKVNVEKDEAAASHGTKPLLKPGINMNKADAEFLAGDLDTAKENYETAKEDVEATGKEDIETGLENKKNADDFMKTFDKSNLP